MKRIYYIFLVLSFVSTGCDKEEKNPDIVIDDHQICDYDLGKYILHPNSILANPYRFGEKISFVDSLLDTMTLSVINVYRPNNTGNSMLYFYNYHVPGDTVIMCYMADNLYVFLQSDKSHLRFGLNISTQPYYSDPRSGKFSDEINIWVNEKDDPNKSYGVFYDIVHQQNAPENTSRVVNLPVFDLFGKAFNQVKYNEFQNTSKKLWYNDTEGIVAFTDHEGKLWRFAKKM
jgi:hypothetical protein